MIYMIGSYYFHKLIVFFWNILSLDISMAVFCCCCFPIFPLSSQVSLLYRAFSNHPAK